MPTRLHNGEGCTDREEPGRGSAPEESTDKHLIRSTGVVSTACREGSPGNWGSPGPVRRSRLRTSSTRTTASLGVGEGRMTEEAG